MVRASIYLLAAGVVWLAEGFIFSRFLGFSTWQIAITAAIYLALFAAAVVWIRLLVRTQSSENRELSPWRYISLAPMIVAIVGSFASLPIILAIFVLGRIV